MFEGLLRDLKVGIRGLVRRPGFTLAAILTLALGIGANTAVFSVIQHVLLAPLPYREPDRAVVIWSKWRGFDKTWVSDAEAIDYRTRVRAFADAGAWSVLQVNLTGDGDPVRIGAALVTPNLFSVLGAAPRWGRVVHGGRGDSVAHDLVILSHGLWQRRFGGEPVIGRSIQVNGIAPAGRRRDAEGFPAADRLHRGRRGADADLAAVSADARRTAAATACTRPRACATA